MGNNKANQYLKYPLYNRPLTLVEKLAIRIRVIPIRCNICGSITVMDIDNPNLRENCCCRNCHSFNRQRQLAFVLCNTLAPKSIRSLNQFTKTNGLSIYNTESGGVLHNYLSKMDDYLCSEYFGDKYESGEMINNIMHQDLMSLSFEDKTFDIILSTDVFEHIPDPYLAHQEVYRVLKWGGRHIFTVPFYQTTFLDEVRASQNENKEINFHKDAIYHEDPLRKDGALVFTIFSIEMLSKLSILGFRTNFYQLYVPINGILGPNAIVFEAIKENQSK
jgi:hypothetical protein